MSYSKERLKDSCMQCTQIIAGEIKWNVDDGLKQMFGIK